MTIERRLLKAKKTNLLFIKLRELAIKEGNLRYACVIDKKILLNKEKIQTLTIKIETIDKQKSWFSFLANFFNKP